MNARFFLIFFFFSASFTSLQADLDIPFSSSQEESLQLAEFEKAPLASLKYFLESGIEGIPSNKREDFVSDLAVEIFKKSIFSKEQALTALSIDKNGFSDDGRKYAAYLFCSVTKKLNVWDKERERPLFVKTWNSLLKQKGLNQKKVIYMLSYGFRSKGADQQEMRHVVIDYLTRYLQGNELKADTQYYIGRVLDKLLYFTPTAENESLGLLYKTLKPFYEKAVAETDSLTRLTHETFARLAARAEEDSFLVNHCTRHQGKLRGQVSVFKAMIENGHYQAASVLLPESDSILRNATPNASNRYTKELHNQLDAYLPLISDPTARQYTNIVLKSLPNAYNPRWPQSKETDRVDAIIEEIDPDLLGSHAWHVDVVGLLHDKPTARALLKETYIGLAEQTNFREMLQQYKELNQASPRDEEAILVDSRYRNAAFAGARLAYQYGDPSLMTALTEATSEMLTITPRYAPVGSLCPWTTWGTTQFIQINPDEIKLEEAIAFSHKILDMTLRQTENKWWDISSVEIMAACRLLHASRHESLSKLEEFVQTLPKKSKGRYERLKNKFSDWKLFQRSYCRNRNYWAWDYNTESRRGFVTHLYSKDSITWATVGDSTHRGFRNGMRHRLFYPKDLTAIFSNIAIDENRKARCMAIAASHIAQGKEKNPTEHRAQADDLMKQARELANALNDPITLAEVGLYDGEYQGVLGNIEKAVSLLEAVNPESLLNDAGRKELAKRLEHWKGQKK